MQRKSKSQIRAILKSIVAALFFGFMILGAEATDALAGVNVSFLYRLSNFNGTVPYSWAHLFVDEERKEIYAIDPRENEVRIFDDNGMEVYRFDGEQLRSPIIDVAVKKDGDMLLLLNQNSKHILLVCNYKGEMVKELALEYFPPEFAGFSPDRMIYRDERIYLLDDDSLSLIVTDTNGRFLAGYDLGLLAEVEEKKRAQTDIGGFSVDRQGNILFTIPVLFRAFRLLPEGKIRGFGSPGGAPGKFNIIGDIVADERGYYYVADRLKSVVIIFDRNFRFVKQFGFHGRQRENLIFPRYLALDTKGRLYVSQLQSRGVSVFQITYD